MLASRKLSLELNGVLNDVIKVINHIEVNVLNSRIFVQLCDEMDTEHRRLLMYTEVRWLSHGRALIRVFELQVPLHRFLLQKKVTTCSTFQQHLYYIFNLLNELNLSLQGKMTTVFKMTDKVAAFMAKLEEWERHVNSGVFDMFPALAETLEETAPGPSFSQLV